MTRLLIAALLAFPNLVQANEPPCKEAVEFAAMTFSRMGSAIVMMEQGLPETLDIDIKRLGGYIQTQVRSNRPGKHNTRIVTYRTQEFTGGDKQIGAAVEIKVLASRDKKLCFIQSIKEI